MANLLEFRDYKEFVSYKIEENNYIKGYRASLAQAAGCQRSFLSLVLNRSSIHFSMEQAVGICGFWRLSVDETDYFLELISLARAGNEVLREVIQRRIEKLLRRQQELVYRFQESSSVDEPHVAEIYYSKWYYSAIHVIASVPEFNTGEALAKRFELPIEVVRRATDFLERAGFISKQGNNWIVNEKTIHLPSSSPLTNLNHVNWRLKAVRDVEVERDASLHYSSVVSISKADFEKIKLKLLSTIDEVRSVVRLSPEQEAVAFCLDLFMA
jgi:uncharacterized protein (TIGR02147 family)